MNREFLLLILFFQNPNWKIEALQVALTYSLIFCFSQSPSIPALFTSCDSQF